ncbi:MAG: ATPase, partial [Mesorhizobium sp.]
MTSNDRPRAIADVSSGTILATVTIAVPPERVFHALTAEDQIPLWWGSDEQY